VTEPRLHLDADTSIKALFEALKSRGHDVTRTPNEWIPGNASDEMQLLGASAHERTLFTLNIKDYIILAARYPHHHGIVLAAQTSMKLSELILSLHRLMCETEASDWLGQVRWLSDWK
jgi:hypothetical protein